MNSGGESGEELPDEVKRYGPFSLEKRRARKDIIEPLKILKGLTGVNAQDMFVQPTELRSRDNGIELWKKRCRQEVRTSLFTSTLSNRWNGLDEELGVVRKTSYDPVRRKMGLGTTRVRELGVRQDRILVPQGCLIHSVCYVVTLNITELPRSSLLLPCG